MKKLALCAAVLTMTALLAVAPSFARQENAQYSAAAVASGSGDYAVAWVTEEDADESEEGISEADENEADNEAGNEEAAVPAGTLSVSLVSSDMPLLGVENELTYSVVYTPTEGEETPTELSLGAKTARMKGEQGEDDGKVEALISAVEAESGAEWTVSVSLNGTSPPAGCWELTLTLWDSGTIETVQAVETFYINYQTSLREE